MPVSIPKFLKSAFAAIGIKNNIPDASDNVTGRAGYDKGFPEINMQPRKSGGIPPDGGDMNGVLYDLSAAIQYIQSGTAFPFNQDFANSIGGYSVGAIVSDQYDLSFLWINGINNNVLYPSVPNGWQQFTLKQATQTYRGLARLSTQTEVNSRTSNDTIVTPSTLSFGFAISIAQNGFLKFPSWMGGLIIQWGQPVVNDLSGLTVTNVAFPTAFSQSSPVVIVSDDSVQLLDYLGVQNRTSTTFQIVALESDTSIAKHTFPWIAIGY